MIPWRATTPRGRWILCLGLVMAVAGALLRYPVVAGIGVVLVVLVTVEVAAVLRRPDVGVHRTVEPLVVVRQQACAGHLRLKGGRTGLVRHLAQECIDGRPMPLVEVTTHETGTTYDIPTGRRGLVAVGPLRLHRVSLCGMASTVTEVGEVVRLRVLPRRIALTSLPAGHRRAATGGADSLELGGTDLVGLHEYTLGDDLRRLHWATSARTGTLMVREDADPAEPHVCVVLDDRQESYELPDDFEEGVELAAALCRVAVEAAVPLRFRTVSGRHDLTVPGSTARHVPPEARDLEWLLAEVDAGPGRASYPMHHRGLDVLAMVTGSGAALPALVLGLDDALDTTVCVVDPEPLAPTALAGAATVLRASGSQPLARLWDGRQP